MVRLPLASIALLIPMAGCMATWVSPTRDDAATLAIVSEVPTAGTYVTPYLFQSGRDCRGTTKLDLPPFGNLEGRTEIRIPPGEEFTIRANVRDTGMFCNIVLSFLPTARQSYTAVISGLPSRCKMSILRSNGKALEAEPSVRKRSWKSGSDSEPQCDASTAPAAP